jgi:uncharacterized oligopeptide transporter (OPT) family protein
VAVGVGLALLIELLGIPSLPFAVGVYLPVATMVPVYFGGLLRLIAEKTARTEEERTDRRERGVLFGSGLVGGEGLLGVGIAGLAAATGAAPAGIGFEWAGDAAQGLAALAFAALIGYFWFLVRRKEA